MTDSSRSERIVEGMLDPATYAHEPEAVELRETHTSWVFLAGGYAYKVKKPVRFPFLDYGTPQRRRQMCREEVRLNRRLAADYYLGVRAVVQEGDGFALAREDHPEALEYAVEMRAIPEELTMAALLQREALEGERIDAVARRLAAFHAEAPVPDRAEEAVGRLADSLAENHETLDSVGPPELSRARLEAAERFTRAFLRARRDELTERRRRGLVREGHGDLRAEHVICTDPVAVYDCVEFDSDLREIDVATDLAFLVMDLARLGSEQAAGRLTVAYRAAGGDPGGSALLSFLASYRAWVRAKVACLRAREEGVGAEERDAALEQAVRLLELGHRFAWRARHPIVVFVCGVAASGKTTLAEAVGAAAGLQVISSDPVRKRLAGLKPSDRAEAAHYSAEFNRRTYEELGRLAGRAAVGEGGAIVDATARHRADRDAFSESFGEAARGVPIAFARCEAPAAVLRERAATRAREPDRVSDADREVVERQIGSFEPLDEVAANLRATVPTDGEPDAAVAAVEELADETLSRPQS